MTKNLGLSFLILLATTAAQAAPDTNTTIVKKPVNQVIEDSSEHNRMKINHQILWNALGSSVSPAIGGGLGYAYQFDRKNALHLEASQGIFPIIFFAEAKASMVGAHYKRYVGNSFYFRTGLDMRKLSIVDKGVFSSNTGREYGQTTDLTAAFVIGNQWQWETFTLGTDWIGLNQPIVNMNRTTDYYTLSGNDRVELEDAWEALGKVRSWQVLRFYIGASF